MSEPFIRASVLQGFEAFASRRQLDFDELLSAAGLSRQQIEDPDGEIPLNAFAQLLSTAADRCGDPCLGLHWAECIAQSLHGVLGYLIHNARSVRHAVKAVARYISLHLDPVDVSFEEADGIGRLQWRFPPTFTAPRIQYASFAMANIIMRLRRSAGANWMPIGVDLEHRELACKPEALRILGPNVRYDCAANTLHIRESVLDRSAPDADHRLFDLIRQLCDRLLAERKTQSDIVAKTRSTIVMSIESGEATLEDIADRMGMSTRTLQARLAAASTTFEDLLQDTRQGLAEIYLRDSDLPLTEIALLLGFSELSAFTRAANRWFGVPPRIHRAELRRVMAPSN